MARWPDTFPYWPANFKQPAINIAADSHDLELRYVSECRIPPSNGVTTNIPILPFPQSATFTYDSQIAKPYDPKTQGRGVGPGLLEFAMIPYTPGEVPK